MMNFPDAVSITGKRQYGNDPDTGLPKVQDVDIAVSAPCAFSVLSAKQSSEVWGDGTAPTNIATVTASLTLPNYGPQIDGELSSYVIRISGWPGTWRAVTIRPGRDWTTLLLQR